VATNQTKAATYKPKRAALNWVDYLVITATALTFLAVVAANNPHAARAQTRSGVISSADLPAQNIQVASEPALIRAEIGLRMGR
jgi:hypothetical protein